MKQFLAVGGIVKKCSDHIGSPPFFRSLRYISFSVMSIINCYLFWIFYAAVPGEKPCWSFLRWPLTRAPQRRPRRARGACRTLRALRQPAGAARSPVERGKARPGHAARRMGEGKGAR